ncbi:hypothetical protein MXB_1532 [Myxobolus squamalis]|nr:hypothetical protein MXB_1532 [Myxobolus squamalis]
MNSYLVQYILIRTDLVTVLKWSRGAVIAQACHASVACIHQFKNDDNTIAYLNNLQRMTKVVLELRDEDILLEWTEQPENIITCLAVKPYPKCAIQQLFRKLTPYN